MTRINTLRLPTMKPLSSMTCQGCRQVPAAGRDGLHRKDRLGPYVPFCRRETRSPQPGCTLRDSIPGGPRSVTAPGDSRRRAMATVPQSRREQGAALLEFALVAPILLMLIFGAIEYGMFFKDYLTVSNTTRTGARVASAAGSDAD